MVDALRRLPREEGVRALYRGFAPAFLQATVGWAFYYCLFDLSRHIINAQLLSGPVTHEHETHQGPALHDHHLPHTPKDAVNLVKDVTAESVPPKCEPTEIPPLANLGGAAVAGALATLAFNPLQVVKLRMVTAPRGSAGFFSTINRILREPASKVAQASMSRNPILSRYPGFPTLYRGLLPALFGVSEGCVQFTAYERLKPVLITSGPMVAGLMLASCSARLMAGLATYPYQYVRSRLQNDTGRYSGVADVVKETVRSQGGVRALWTGLAPNLIRTVPPAGILLTLNDSLREFLHRKFGHKKI
ncbi:hypothetical protein HDV00_004283 [Rhizophlyctis rosea]|nr:hypothetical protein HDV00_004283 [Rhizophlyctis rosea]